MVGKYFRSFSILLLLLLPGCGGELGEFLDDLSGKPKAEDATGTIGGNSAHVPAGPHLYCLTNIGHTLVAFSLTENRVLADTRTTVALDPIGPWFSGESGYYLSQVAASGAGANSLISFDPETLVETGRLNFPGNSNPSAFLLLPDGQTAYVALKGSTFDNFATNGLAVVDLPSMTTTGFLDLNDPGYFIEGEPLVSLGGLIIDPGCSIGTTCVYAVADNWRNEARQGWLLALEPLGQSVPAIRDAIPLGFNPRGTLMLDNQGELWVVNNGGYADYNGLPGTLQALDTGAFADGLADNETVALLEIGGDPTGIFPFSNDQAWVTTYPDDTVRTVNLTDNSLLPVDPSLPNLTGPLISTTSPTPALYAGLGGYGPARLGLLDRESGALLSEYHLQSGNGPVSCAEFTRPSP